MKFYECLPDWVADCVKGKKVREIRLRNNAVVRVNVDGSWLYCSIGGLTTQRSEAKKLDVPCDDVVQIACNRSIYAYERMLAAGYLTLSDGSRFGVSGSYSQDGKLFREYTGVCIRVPHCIACANVQILSAVQRGNTLIVGAPGLGKTTLLRDIARQLSLDNNVVVVDERGELDVEDTLIDCDVLKWTSKNVGVEMALRCLAPSYILCDELSRDDFNWISRATNAGVKVVSTFHAGSFADVQKLCGEACNCFGNIILCESVGQYKCLEIN